MKMVTCHIYSFQLEVLTYTLQVLATEKPKHYVFVNSSWLLQFQIKRPGV